MSLKRRIKRLEDRAPDRSGVPFVIIDSDSVTVEGIGQMSRREYEEHHAGRIRELRAEAEDHPGCIYGIDFTCPA